MTTDPGFVFRPEPVRPWDLIVKLDEWKGDLEIKINSLREAINGGIDDPRDVLEAVPRIDPPDLVAQPVLAAVESLMVHGKELVELLRGVAS